MLLLTDCFVASSSQQSYEVGAGMKHPNRGVVGDQRKRVKEAASVRATREESVSPS